ncbi:6-phosphogluconate dehydrogenase C-terminal domain-like protein [Coniochaeta ligniaria NRRL 30616]|uniref:6-phosphogluconate dehydrogenase C-terminal domain-like protein n=1 Tax=Coniochaeta ligniaria NRRL 30616 TaxID=1408157 RepID=A0A1J7K1U1_9PEZI|nr:6-phosphogluconate dehydrogenase C-terminal domain-like protein [Coniochaeta ligniaria NRRL 30616]
MTKSARLATPRWLEAIVQDRSPAPRLYSWSLDNLPGEHGKKLRQAKASQTSPEEKRRIHILGIGNLGRLYAHSLANLPHRPPVTLVVHRKALLEHWISDPGVEITRSGVTERVDDFDIEWWTEDKPDVGPVVEVCEGQTVSNLIVATKAPDALPQVDRLRRYLGDKSTVAFVQNGMNKLWPPFSVEYHNKRYPSGNHPNWIVCVTTHGVTSLGTFKSLHASPADVAMGTVCLNSHNALGAEYLMGQIMSAPYLDARKVSSSDLWVLQLEKLVVNCVINPLTAVLRCKNGVLFSNPHGLVVQVMDLLVKEASGVLQALVRDDSSRVILLGEHEDPTSDTEQVLKVKQSELLDRFSAPRLRSMLHSVGQKVKDNKSSMLQDVVAGKQTEIREFNGWLVDTAGYLGGGLDVSSHEALIALVEEGVILDESQLGKYFPLP